MDTRSTQLVPFLSCCNPCPSDISLCHQNILCLQISSEFNRFNESMAEKPRVAIFYGGVNESEDVKTLKSADSSPHIVVGTPGRIKAVRLLLQAVFCCSVV